MKQFEQTPQNYDHMYAEGGYEGVYNLPANRSWFYPLHRRVIRELHRRGVRSVLEVGCGSGAFATLLLKDHPINYKGFDFSKTAIELAQARTGRPDLFFVADATRSESYQGDYEAIVCTEVLEHIEEDLTAVSAWQAGTFCLCSVPNFDAKSHVRFFRNEGEVTARYGVLIDIQGIVRIRKPPIPDISMQNYLRHLLWNRYRPKRLLELLGFGSDEEMGCWFLLYGRRR